nr:PRC-barrel domain-containing protein [Angustibacter aerolatus]
MSGPPARVYVARLAGLAVFDPQGDQVGRLRDVVVVFRANRQPPLVIGLVVEVPGRRRVFLPMTRVTSIDGGQVITTGVLNMRRFEQRQSETLVLGEPARPPGRSARRQR